MKTPRESRRSRLLFPLTERRFVYDRYDAFLERLAGNDRFVVQPLRELARQAPDVDRVVIGLRHDVDSRLDSALTMARLENRRRVRATYFVLHTAPYWSDPELDDRLRELQDLGHEIGWHNDLLTVHRLHGADPAVVLRAELGRLRAAGLDIRGSAAHGSSWCHRLGYHNNYLFEGWDEPVPGLSDRTVPQKLRPADFGLEYEAYHLDEDRYLSDAQFEAGRRWHPDDLDLDALSPGTRVVVLVHPCHWDRSAAAKAGRLGRRLLARIAGGGRSRAAGRARATP